MEKIQALYHFTSVENLPSIRRMGALCSKQVLEDANLWPVSECGGNELSHNLDRWNDNWDKVALNFTPHTPMLYHKKQQCHLCFFVIKVDVATFAGVVFTDTNATSSNQRRGEGPEGLDLVNFDAVRSLPRPWDRDGWVRPVQAEILVPDRIPLNYVSEVVFVSKASLEDAERLWGPQPHPPFRVASTYFSDTPGARTTALNFAHAVEILLTDLPVDKSNVRDVKTHKSTFARSTTDRITAIVSIHAIAGVRAQVTWNPGNTTSTTEFEKSQRYLHWPRIQIDRLPNGKCYFEYRLGDIRWVTVEFHVTP
jgi:hypothetical protein